MQTNMQAKERMFTIYICIHTHTRFTQMINDLRITQFKNKQKLNSDSSEGKTYKWPIIK